MNPKTKNYARTPLQDVSVATMHLREVGLVPWHWIEDETRTLSEWTYAPTVAKRFAMAQTFAAAGHIASEMQCQPHSAALRRL